MRQRIDIICDRIRPAPNVLEIVTYMYYSVRILRIFTYYSFVLSKIILRRYTCIRNTIFKTVESNEVKSLVLAANVNKVRYEFNIECLSVLLEYIDLS